MHQNFNQKILEYEKQSDTIKLENEQIVSKYQAQQNQIETFK